MNDSPAAEWRCRQCGSPLEKADPTGVTFRWPDETPFDPQPEEWSCTNPECNFAYLVGLTGEQGDRLMGLRQPVGSFKGRIVGSREPLEDA